MTTPQNDQSAIERVLEGNSEAFGELVARYNQQLFRAARSILKDKAASEDVLQQAYLNAFTRLKQFESRSSFSTWMTRIVIREAIHSLRKGQVLSLEDRRLTKNDQLEKSWRQSPISATERNEANRAIECAIDQLSDSLRTVFVMREVQGQSISEIADVLELNEALIRIRLFRAKRALRKSLGTALSVDEVNAFPFLGSDCAALHGRVLAALKKNKNIFLPV